MQCSAIVFGSSAQFVRLFNCLAAPIWVIRVDHFYVNLRHLLYAADLLMKFCQTFAYCRSTVMGFWVIDETYAAVRPCMKLALQMN